MKLVGAVVALLLMSADTGADERTILRLRGWIDAVDSHAAGQTDPALAIVTAWTYDDLELMRPYVEDLCFRRRIETATGSAAGDASAERLQPSSS